MIFSGILNSWVGQPQQTWSVIFKASEHNFQSSSFHAACAGAAPSIVIVKSDTGYICGGFTEVPWSTPASGKGRYVASDHSFLFSLHCPTGPNVRKFDIKKKLFAVSHHPNCGPIFGAGADLFIANNCDKVKDQEKKICNDKNILMQVCDSYSNLPHSYTGSGDYQHPPTSSSLMGEYNFLVEEYEVLVPVQT